MDQSWNYFVTSTILFMTSHINHIRSQALITWWKSWYLVRLFSSRYHCTRVPYSHFIYQPHMLHTASLKPTLICLQILEQCQRDRKYKMVAFKGRRKRPLWGTNCRRQDNIKIHFNFEAREWKFDWTNCELFATLWPSTHSQMAREIFINTWYWYVE